VLSLRFPSPSSSDAFREGFREFAPEVVREVERDVVFDLAFFDTVFPLSRACLRKSCMVTTFTQMQRMQRAGGERSGDPRSCGVM
jgi:hypothetical protein